MQGPGGRGGEGEVVPKDKRRWKGGQEPDLEGPTGQPKEGRREPLWYPKPLKEKVRFTFLSDSNCPPPSFQVSLGMPGLGDTPRVRQEEEPGAV